jgi:hypothetical protein
MMRSPGDSTTSNFVVALLRALDFAPKGTMVRTGKNFSFRLGGKKRYAMADICIVEGTDPLLIVQQDKLHVDLGRYADSRLIATAIAAYDKDSLHRVKYGLPARSGRRRIVGIVISGSWPTFFKIDPISLISRVKSNIGTVRILAAPASRKKSYWLIAPTFRGPNSG